MASIKVFRESGAFAENKDAAARLRDQKITPALKKSGEVNIDFDGVEYATQSFVHAMIAGLIRDDPERLDRLVFSNCSEAVEGVLEIVVDYAQEDV